MNTMFMCLLILLAFQVVVSNPNFSSRMFAMQNGLTFILHNDAWDLIELPHDCESIGHK